MRARLWIPAVSGLIVLAIGIALGRANVPPEMHFRFLAGRKPDYSSIDELGWLAQGDLADFTMGTYSNRDGPAVKVRQERYTFRGDYDAVAAAARREVFAAGGTEDHRLDAYLAASRKRIAARGQNPQVMEMANLRFNGDCWLYIRRTRQGGASGPEDSTWPYVEVRVVSQRSESFLGVAQRWLRARLH